MRAPAFWWKPAPDLLAQALSPLARLYGAAAAKRMTRTGERVAAPVICVGNFVAGGAGKTPTAIALAQELIRDGHKPFFLSRGYGAAKPIASPTIVDQARHSAADVGDEPLLLARIAPAIVCADRVAGARAAVANGATVIVMDDGLQNPSLHKDFQIAVVDGAVGVGNGYCIPAGPLRAPLDVQMKQIDALLVIGPGEAGQRIETRARTGHVSTGRARLTPDENAAARLRGKRVFAFAGIGRPDKFFSSLESTGALIAKTRAFADHHPYSPEELASLRGDAAHLGALLVTTEKDAARIADADDMATLPISLTTEERGYLEDLVRAALAKAAFRA
jgi:tetraacyldisaccharide 4'-kinase